MTKDRGTTMVQKLALLRKKEQGTSLTYMCSSEKNVVVCSLLYFFWRHNFLPRNGNRLSPLSLFVYSFQCNPIITLTGYFFLGWVYTHEKIQQAREWEENGKMKGDKKRRALFHLMACACVQNYKIEWSKNGTLQKNNVGYWHFGVLEGYIYNV